MSSETAEDDDVGEESQVGSELEARDLPLNGASHSATPDDDDDEYAVIADKHNDGARRDDDDYVPTSDNEDADEEEDEEREEQSGRAQEEDEVDEEEQLATRVKKRRRRGATRRWSVKPRPTKPRQAQPRQPRKRRKPQVSSESEQEEEVQQTAAENMQDGDEQDGEEEERGQGAEDEDGEGEVEDEDGEVENENEEEEDDEPLLVQPVTDSREITISMDKLNKYLACRLCGGYYRDATTIIECAHTFCKLCLSRHIDQTSEHKDTLCPYPKCPTRLKTADPLRNETKFDRALQNLVDKLLPQFSQADEVLRREIQSSAGLRRGTSEVSTGRRRRAEPSMGAALLFELTPHPSSSLPPLPKPLIKTQPAATVRNIRQLLLQQLRLKVDESELLVYCSDELLAADHSLDFIRRTRWHEPDKHMQIQYKMV